MADASSLHVADLVCGHAERGLFEPVTFTLSPGGAIQIAGPNGQGKTTLFRAIAGLSRPLSGQVSWRGDGELTDTLTFIGHDNAMNAALTPLENLDLLLRLGCHHASEQRVKQTLESLGLARVVHRPCGRLSAGQRRRVALARLWLEDTRVWLLDEPAAALDADARVVLCARISEFVKQGGMVLFTTHEPLQLPGAAPTRLMLQPC